MSFATAIASAVALIRRGVDPRYESQFNEEKQVCRNIGMIAVVGVVASVALDILGVGLAVSEVVAAGIGVSLIFASLPFAYLGVNFYMISKNMLEIFNNHSAYRTLGLGYFDRQRVKAQLERRTFFCNWAVEIVAESFVRGGRQ